VIKKPQSVLKPTFANQDGQNTLQRLTKQAETPAFNDHTNWHLVQFNANPVPQAGQQYRRPHGDSHTKLPVVQD
jgi:hypothetical protein